MPQTVNDFALPPLYCPLPKAVSSFTDRAEQHVLEWLDSTELGRRPHLRNRALELRGHRSAGFCLNGAEDEELFRIIACFGVWILTSDDVLEAQPDAGRAAEVAGRYLRAFTAPGYRLPNRELAGDEEVFIDAACGLAEQLRARCHPTHYNRLVHELRHYYLGALRMLASGQCETPPSEDQYLAMRMEDGAVRHIWVMMEIGRQEVVPDDEFCAPAVQAALDSAATSVILDNDLYSYRKELDEPGKVNLVTVIRDNRGVSLEEAVAEAVTIRDRTLLLFLRLHERLKQTAGPALSGVLDQIARVTRGHLEWAMETPRYRLSISPEEFPWPSAPSTTDSSPLPYPSISWWWNHL
ncbi:hypothetical protein ABT381_10265 [Streptomyces sp. NPDC000151]|uniref:terpene synthase family protein n=1 Tax=Streptomyces sp. NPDC000151 TaxID=3154244 RepID=UPI0033341B76